MDSDKGRILLVFAHPDDESFLGGGTLAYYEQQGHHTALLTVTDGQAGRAGLNGRDPLATRDTLAALRREETQRAVAILGIGELIQPGWMDGALADVPDEKGTALVVEEIRRLRPHVIMSFGPEGGGNGHADHKATCRWTEAAFDKAADPNYPSERPPHTVLKYYWQTWPSTVDLHRGISSAPTTTVIELGEAITRIKVRAFEEHQSQHDHLEMYKQIQEDLGHCEYFRLAQSRVGGTDVEERDLFEGIELG